MLEKHFFYENTFSLCFRRYRKCHIASNTTSLVNLPHDRHINRRLVRSRILRAPQTSRSLVLGVEVDSTVVGNHRLGAN